MERLKERPHYTAYIDAHGAITQHPAFGADEGDCAHKEAFYALGCELAGMVPRKPMVTSIFFPNNDMRLCRHAEATRPWIRRMNRGSRDQYSNWICWFTYRSISMASAELHDLLQGNDWRFFNYKKNGRLEAPDKKPDLMAPDLYGILIRGMTDSPRYLWFWDFTMALGSLHWRWFRKDSNDICNHLAIVATARHRNPTFWSNMAWKWLDKQATIDKLKGYFDWPGYCKPGEAYMDAWWVAEPWIKYVEDNK